MDSTPSATASAPAYAHCSPAEWDAWYAAVGALGAETEDFGLLETVGQELKTMKVPFTDGWGDNLNDLQLGRLRNKLRTAESVGSPPARCA